MATEREIQETVAKCVAIMVFYVNVQKTRQAKALMIAEIQAVAGFVKKWDLNGKATVDSILRPVEAELFARYGCEVAGRLNAEFVEAFEKRIGPDLVFITSPV